MGHWVQITVKDGQGPEGRKIVEKLAEDEGLPLRWVDDMHAEVFVSTRLLKNELS
jgi:hypothetical protein